MDDLISKADVCEILADMYPTDGEAVISYKEIDRAYTKVQCLPTVDAAPVKHGKWEVTDSGLWQSCSLCGVAVEVDSMFMCKASEDSNFLYCPHCGARMFGEDEKDAVEP